MDSLRKIILENFDFVLQDHNSIKKKKIRYLGVIYILKTKYNFLIGISLEYRDNYYSLSLDYDITKFDSELEYLSINIGSFEFEKEKEGFIKNRLAGSRKWLFFKDNNKIVKANIEYFAIYIKQNLEKIINSAL